MSQPCFSSHIQIRPYQQQADFLDCLNIADANIPQFFPNSDRPGIESFLKKRWIPYFVARCGDRIVGSGGYSLNGTSGHLYAGMVHPEYHRQGIGSILLKYRLRNLFNAGATRITLDTSPESCGFFMRHGFNACAITPNGIAPGRDMVSMVLLRTKEPTI